MFQLYFLGDTIRYDKKIKNFSGREMFLTVQVWGFWEHFSREKIE